MTPPEIRHFRLADLDSVRPLWAASEGLGIGPGDSTDAIGRFLERNHGLSLVAVDGATMVAAELVRRCLADLKAASIERCLALVRTSSPFQSICDLKDARGRRPVRTCSNDPSKEE
jgi:hypothetical protein